MHKQFKTVAPMFSFFLQLTSFAQDLLCCKFNPFPYQIVLHLGSKKLDHHIIGGIRPISSDQIPTNSPLDCYYWSTKSPCSTKKKTWNFLPKSPWTPNLIASYITMFHPKNPMSFLTCSVIFSPKSQTSDSVKRNEDFSPAKEIRLFLRAFRRACRCLKKCSKNSGFHWWNQWKLVILEDDLREVNI